MTRLCAVCGQSFPTGSSNAKYCPACREAANRERDRIQKCRSRREKKAASRPSRSADRDVWGSMHCRGCKWSMRVGSTRWYNCSYMERTGRRRPCPSPLTVGRRCDVYETGKEAQA